MIIGKSGSGKDYLLSYISEKGLKPCLKWTTRPQRESEHQGITYNFVDNTSFINSINENAFLAYQTFLVTPKDKDPETWYYGITNEEFDSSQVFIMTPGEFENVSPVMRSQCFVVYLDIDRSILTERLRTRNDSNDSIERRLDADNLDFMNFNDYDLRITDPEYDPEIVWDLMG